MNRAQVVRAETRLIEARLKFHSAVAKAFPEGCTVGVEHSRGYYRATVVRHDFAPGYLIVRNNASGKTSKQFWRKVRKVI